MVHRQPITEDKLFRQERILFLDIVGEELCHRVGGHVGDVKDEVIVAGIVARGIGDSFDECVASLVGFVDDLGGLFGIEVLLGGDAGYTCITIGNDEQVQRIGIVGLAKDEFIFGFNNTMRSPKVFRRFIS